MFNTGSIIPGFNGEAPVPVDPNGTEIYTGGRWWWTGVGLTFYGEPTTGIIQGEPFSWAGGNVTLAAADPTNPRLDGLGYVLPGTGTSFQGTPAPTPVAPTADPATELIATLVLIPAASLTPSITETLIYDEDAGPPTEYTAATNAPARIDLASTNNPYQGTVCIRVTHPAADADNVTFTAPAALALTALQVLSFRIRLDNNATNRLAGIRLYLRNAANQIVAYKTVASGNNGYNAATGGTYQQVLVLYADWQFTGAGLEWEVLEVEFDWGNGPPGRSFNLDLFQFQSGFTPQPTGLNIFGSIVSQSGTRYAQGPNDPLGVVGTGGIATSINADGELVVDGAGVYSGAFSFVANFDGNPIVQDYYKVATTITFIQLRAGATAMEISINGGAYAAATVPISIPALSPVDWRVTYDTGFTVTSAYYEGAPT